MENGNGSSNGGISKADMERLIAAAAQTAPAQTIRIEQAPIQFTTLDSELQQKNLTRCNLMNFFKWTALGVGGVVAVAHIGVLGHIIQATKTPEVPIINLPRGDYSSYKIEAGKEGYSIEYKANDPAVLNSERSLDLDKNKRGFFGGNSNEKRTEYRRDEYTMDGTRNLGGAVDGEGKSARDIECIVADAGARSHKVQWQELVLLLVLVSLL